MEREASDDHGRARGADAIEEAGIDDASFPMDDVERLPAEGMQVEDV